MIGVIGNTSGITAEMCRSTIMHVPHSCSDCQWYIFQELWQIMKEEISMVVASKATRQNNPCNPCPQFNVEPLLVCRMDYTIRILLCPLVLVVSIDDAVSTETSLICKEH
jgi:hypothetical protein